MSVLIGDLMAVADDGVGAGGRKRKRGAKKRLKVRGVGGASQYRGSSARKERGLQDDTTRKKRGLRDYTDVENPPERKSLRLEKWLPPKRMGELSELDFLRKTMGMGMIVSKPWGDSYRYDFICDTGKLWKVQVRSTEFPFGPRGYAVHASVYVGRKIVGLTEKDCDVIVAYIVSRDIWYGSGEGGGSEEEFVVLSGWKQEGSQV
jgi:ribosomal protein L35